MSRPVDVLRFATAVCSALLLVTLAACSWLAGPTPGAPLRQPAEPIRIDAATLAADGSSLRIDFIGGAEFDPNNPCSVAYIAEAEVVADELRIGVFALQHPLGLDAGEACELIGYARTLGLTLDAPFRGTRIADRAGQVFFLRAPDGLVEITGLPEGWSLRRQESLIESPTGRWQRVYAPLPDPGSHDSSVTLIQAFGGPVDVTGGGIQPDVVVNGVRATLYLHEPSGEMVLVWHIGGDGVALVGYLRDFTPDEFLRLAESIVPAG